MMFLLPVWALNVSVVLLSMQGQKALGFIKNILICVPKINEGLTGFWTTCRWVINNNFNLWVNYPFNVIILGVNGPYFKYKGGCRHSIEHCAKLHPLTLKDSCPCQKIPIVLKLLITFEMLMLSECFKKCRKAEILRFLGDISVSFGYSEAP